MNCQQCISAERDPQIGLFNAGCKECLARHLAHGYEFWESQRERRITARYRYALSIAFGDGWEVGHLRVKAWAKRIKEKK